MNMNTLDLFIKYMQRNVSLINRNRKFMKSFKRFCISLSFHCCPLAANFHWTSLSLLAKLKRFKLLCNILYSLIHQHLSVRDLSLNQGGWIWYIVFILRGMTRCDCMRLRAINFLPYHVHSPQTTDRPVHFPLNRASNHTTFASYCFDQFYRISWNLWKYFLFFYK